MHTNVVNVLFLAVIATSLSLTSAAPLYTPAEKRAVGAIVGGLVRGAATGALEAGAEDIKNDLGLRRRAIGPIVEGLARGAVSSAVGSIFDNNDDNSK